MKARSSKAGAFGGFKPAHRHASSKSPSIKSHEIAELNKIGTEEITRWTLRLDEFNATLPHHSSQPDQLLTSAASPIEA